MDKKQVVITERRIGKVTYLVHASSSERATDTIHKKIEKLIVKDLQKKARNFGLFRILVVHLAAGYGIIITYIVPVYSAVGKED